MSPEVLSPKEAKEAARKLLEAGKLTIIKKAPTKRTGFKRVGEVPGQVGMIKCDHMHTYGLTHIQSTNKKPNTGRQASTEVCMEQPYTCVLRDEKNTNIMSNHTHTQSPSKPKIRATDVKALYSRYAVHYHFTRFAKTNDFHHYRFVKASNPADDLGTMTVGLCRTIHVC